MATGEATVTILVNQGRDLLRTEAVNRTMDRIHQVLFRLGVPPPYMDAERLAISIIAGIVTLVAYFVLFGKRHRRRRHILQQDLVNAQLKVQQLQEKLADLELDTLDSNKQNKKEVRIWMDGAFDMMHYGHMNAFRQGKALGTYLVVGVNDDKSITECKGAPPVMNDEERITAVEGCKFVDVVERHCPYVMNEEYLNHVIEKHKIDYVVHGDDPCIVDGKDVYATAKALGKYRSIPRTEGVSTSDILGRMLLLNKAHHTFDLVGKGDAGHLSSKMKDQYERPSKFLTTNRMLRLFSAGNRDPSPNAKIVYVDGAFDMFHPGHIKLLEQAKKEGDYLIAGIHNDSLVNKHRGLNYPIMNLHERVLSVLGCRFVDDILIDAPWEITREMIASLNISVVVHGASLDRVDHSSSKFSMEKQYVAPKELKIFKEIKTSCSLDVGDIVDRINANRERFEKKFEKKMEAEQEYYDERYAHVKS